VSKKIKQMGLRLSTAPSGRMKGEKLLVKENERTLLDLEKMTEILKKYAPLNVFLRAELNLKDGCWLSPLSPPSKGLEKGCSVERVEKENASFYMNMPLDYIVSQDPPPLRRARLKTFKEPLCVPLYQVETWALREGFQQTQGVLQEHGLSYWKDGRHFSQAQLLIYINQIRHNKKLQPLLLLEEEAESMSEESCCESS
jgi:hypothetical protein